VVGIGLGLVVVLSAVAAEAPWIADLTRRLGASKATERKAARRDVDALSVEKKALLIQSLKNSDDPELEFIYRRLKAAAEALVYKHDQRVDTNAESVRDGRLVLLRKGTVYGAVVLQNQNTAPETASYTWVLMPAGVGSIDPSAKDAKTGKGETGVMNGREQPIAFGPFKIYWSGGGKGNGWIYYNYYERKQLPPNQRTVMALADDDIKLESVEKMTRLDARAADLSWKYRVRN
jgi:hypothetical protein